MINVTPQEFCDRILGVNWIYQFIIDNNLDRRTYPAMMQKLEDLELETAQATTLVKDELSRTNKLVQTQLQLCRPQVSIEQAAALIAEGLECDVKYARSILGG